MNLMLRSAAPRRRAALDDRIFASPALVAIERPVGGKIYGTLSDESKLLNLLGINHNHK